MEIVEESGGIDKDGHEMAKSLLAVTSLQGAQRPTLTKAYFLQAGKLAKCLH